MAYENLSREELISALENLTGVDQFAAGLDRPALPAPRDPQTGEDLGWMNQDERERFYRHQEQFPEGEDMGWSDYDPAAVHFRADLPRIQGQVDAQGYIGPYGRPDLAAAAQARRDAIFGASVVPNPLRSGGAPAYYRDQPEATPFYEGRIPYFGTDPNLAGAMRDRGATGYDYSTIPSTEEVLNTAVVRPIGETIDRVMRQPEQGRAPIGGHGFEPASEQDLMFHEVQKALRRGEEPEAPQWMIDMVRAVPEEDWASAFAGGDEALKAFHQKHGFPPDVGGGSGLSL
jgi:hypothetical protein